MRERKRVRERKRERKRVRERKWGGHEGQREEKEYKGQERETEGGERVRRE